MGVWFLKEEEVCDEEPGDEGKDAKEIEGVPLHPARCPCYSLLP